MLNVTEKDLILKFLEKNFPTYRLKHKMRFKRAIVLDDSTYLLGDKESTKTLYFKLLDILMTVFFFEKTITENTLKTFLNLRQSYQNNP